MKYTIVALPQRKTLAKLNVIKDYLYTHNFRYTNTPPKGTSHITLSQLEFPDNSDTGELRQLLQTNLEDFQPFSLSHRKVTNQEHERIKTDPELLRKYPNGCGWIALLFQSPQLISLSQSIIQIISSLGIDRSLDYAKNIAQAKGQSIAKFEEIYEYLANHMNICNYIRLEKADEAVEYFLQHFVEKEIGIHKIALVSEKQEILWEI